MPEEVIAISAGIGVNFAGISRRTIIRTTTALGCSLIAPRVAPAQLNDDALGRALDTLYAYGVTELYRLIAATAAMRQALTPTFAHLASTSFHVDGRYHREEAPEAEVMHIPSGYRRDPRPDLNQVMLE